MAARIEARKDKHVKKFPAFGEKLLAIVTGNLPEGSAKDKNAAVTFFQSEKAFGFDRSCAYAWFKGDVLGAKPLVPDNFKRILLFYIGKCGLRTIEEIQEWIDMGPDRYRAIYSSAELQEKLRAMKLPKVNNDYGEQLTEREKVWDHLLQRVAAASTLLGQKRTTDPAQFPNLIVIQGPPGMGKTLFLNRLWRDPMVNSHFDEVVHANCDANMTPEILLDFCLRKLLGETDGSPGRPAILKSDIDKATRGKRIILLLDHVSSPKEVDILRPLCEMGCLLVAATRSLSVARLAGLSNVLELGPFSVNDLLEYYSKSCDAEASAITQEKIIELAKKVCSNPLGLNIALRRVAEEGWDSVMRKLSLAPSIRKGDIVEDLHHPLWLAYSSLGEKDQEMFRRLGAFPTLASYDEVRLGRLWGVSKIKANEILLRMEKEAGLAQRCPQKLGCWKFHPQVLHYARYMLRESPLRSRIFAKCYPLCLAFHENRPRQFHHLYKQGIHFGVVKKYWQMIHQERKRRRMPIVLAELRRLVDPTYSTDWSIFRQLTSNCSLEDYVWGFRNFLGGGADLWIYFLCSLFYIFLNRIPIGKLLAGKGFSADALNLFLLIGGAIWGFHLVFRDIRRRYDWGQLWQKVTTNRDNNEEG